MNCERVQEDLPAYLSGELPPEHARRVAAHLSQCQACAGELAAMQDLDRRLRLGLTAWVEAGEAPPDLEPLLRQAVRRREPVDVAEVLASQGPEASARRVAAVAQQARRRTWGLVAAVAAAAAALALLVPAQPEGARPRVVGGILGLFRGEVAVRPGATASAGGVTLAVAEVRFGAQATHVACTLTGMWDGLPALRLVAGGQELPLQAVQVQAGQPWRLVATYGPAPRGVPLRLVAAVAPGQELAVDLPARP